MEFTPEEASRDLKNYFKYMRHTEVYLKQLIAIEDKYDCYGGTPQMVSEEISKYINQGDSK